MAGPRQPVDLVLHKGKKHLTKEEIAKRKSLEIKANSDKVKPPSSLPKELRREFKKIADELLAIGIMTNLDVNALAFYIESYDHYRFLDEKLRETRDEEEFDIDKFKDISVERDRIVKQCRSAASDLGLTISSRCKLVVPKKEEEKKESKFAKFGAGNRV